MAADVLQSFVGWHNRSRDTRHTRTQRKSDIVYQAKATHTQLIKTIVCNFLFLILAMAVKERNTKITVSVEDADPSSDPMVVSFPGGAPVDVNPQFVQRRLREGAKVGRKLVGRDLTCLYQAENLGRGNDGRRTKLCIALYNKKTGTLTVSLAAEKGTVFALEQSIPKYTPVDTEQTTAAQRRKALFQDFGSSKKQKTLKSQEANRVTVDSVIGAGSLMAGAFSAQTKMSASNRKALDDNKRGEKVGIILDIESLCSALLIPTLNTFFFPCII